MPVETGPVPLVEGENTYLAVTFDTTNAFLYVYTSGNNINSIPSYQLARPPYLPATHASGAISLEVGINAASAALVPPFPGPSGFLYPFVGRMAKVAIYNTVLNPDRIQAHVAAAFNT